LTPGPTDKHPGQSIYILDKAPDRSKPLAFLGGETKFFGAAFYRFREADFQAVEHEAGVSPAWPISYQDLEPYYDQAEVIYRVHGDRGDDPTEPQGRAPFPHPPVPYAPLVEAFAARLAKAGAALSPVPRAVDYGPGGRCVNCPSCDGFYCVRDAKMDAEIAAIRPAIKTGKVDLATGSTVSRLELDASQSHVIGCRVERGGQEIDVSADVVVAAGGLKGTVELFLRSRTSSHPDGLGNGSGQLGRNLAGHSTNMIFPFVSLRALPPVQTKSFAINAFYNGAPDWPYPLGIVQAAGRMPIWRDVSRPMRPLVKFITDHCLTLFQMTEAPPIHAAGFTFEDDRVTDLVPPRHSLGSIARLRTYILKVLWDSGYVALARRREPYLWHPVGTTRMGDDPKASVTNRFGGVHGIGGLYVADAGILPTAGAVNTGLTIAALSLRTADSIVAS
jgi:choline dehydrogenase-like flavoprotein